RDLAFLSCAHDRSISVVFWRVVQRVARCCALYMGPIVARRWKDGSLRTRRSSASAPVEKPLFPSRQPSIDASWPTSDAVGLPEGWVAHRYRILSQSSSERIRTWRYSEQERRILGCVLHASAEISPYLQTIF